jgi:GGDEF domain-containing protein
VKTVVIVKKSMDRTLSSVVKKLSDSVKVIRADEDILSLIYMDPPDLIVFDRSYLADSDPRIISEFRSNTIYGHLPVIAAYRKDDIKDRAAIELPVDDFVVLDNPSIETLRRIEFVSSRARREMDTNPLTRLPGNESIIRFIQKMFDLGKEIAIGWTDLDNFKPYNDRYGFASGDEVLLATARILTNALKDVRHEDTFLGHVGGDDFVFVCPVPLARGLCEQILTHFDMVIRNFYADEDLDDGGIVSTTRAGETKKFSIMSLSIAVVTNEKNQYRHYGEASQDATDIKKYVKGLDGSNYMINRRKRA